MVASTQVGIGSKGENALQNVLKNLLRSQRTPICSEIIECHD